MDSLSFDQLVDLYDRTRICDQGCFGAAVDYIAEQYPPGAYCKLLEPGVGTGRIAIAMAEKGYRVTGVDVSEKMLELLAENTKHIHSDYSIDCCLTDATALPFDDGSFDIAVASHLFYFIPEWKKFADELLRVVREDGPVVMFQTGYGTEIPFLNDRYKELCVEQGYLPHTLGARSMREVVEYCEKSGCRSHWTQGCWQWNYEISLREALDYINRRAYSFTLNVPDNVHLKSIETMETEIGHNYGSLDTRVTVPNQVYLVILRRPAVCNEKFNS